MNIKTKFCSMSTKFGTMYLSLFHSPSLLFDDLCDIFIVPEDSVLPTLRFAWSSRHECLYAFIMKSGISDGLLRISPIMDKSESFVVELDIVNFMDISEIQRIAEDTIKWKEYWQDITFPIENASHFVPDFPNPECYIG